MQRREHTRRIERRNLNLDYLESFVALADHLGVTAAAKQLRRAQPTVSQHIQRLEEQLRRHLVIRSRSGAILTDEGRRLLPVARSLLRLNEQLSAAPEYRLRLGACTNIGVYSLSELLISFRAKGHSIPDIAIGNNPEIIRRLCESELDLALLEWWDERAGFESHVWRKEQLFAIVPRNHPLAAKEQLTLKDLSALPMLGGEPGTGTGRLLHDKLAPEERIQVAMNLGSTEAVKRAVSAGLGCSIVLKCAVAEHRNDASPIAVRPLIPLLHKTLHLVWRTDIPSNEPLLAHLRSSAC